LRIYSQNKKLNYRRDSACRQSLRASKSFKVTDFGTIRKFVCGFYVNNANLYPISHCFPVIAQSLLIKECLSLTHSFSAISVNMEINHIFQKTTFIGLHFCCRQCGSSCNPSECDAFSVIIENSSHYAVQGHSRSPISIKLLQINGQIFISDKDNSL